MNNSLRIDNQHAQTSTRNGGVTELVLTHNHSDYAQFLLPMIAYISNSCEDRWMTWIAPQNITRKMLEEFGVNTRFIRLIHTTDDQHVRWVTWEALAAGNSHTVIASPGKLTDKELQQLELAAAKGNCQGLLLRIR